MRSGTLSVQSRLRESYKIVDESERINDFLHSPEYVVNKMKQVFSIFPEPSMGLALDMLCTILPNDGNLTTIIEEQCGEGVTGDDVFPFLMFYCSIIIFTEYVRIQCRTPQEEVNV